MNKQVGIVGYGYVGKAYHKMFPDAIIYDEPLGIGSRKLINACDMAIVCVPSDPLRNGELDMHIVEDVIDWIETPLILIKSALWPGTVDRLVKKTGKKIAVSIEYLGMGKYYIPIDYPDPEDPRKHQMIVIGGGEETASKCAEILWEKMSPTIRIYINSALEVEIGKLVENSYPALKVTWINCLYNLAKKSNTNFIRIHQGWTADPRVDGMHQRTTSNKRGWKSHCWDKDVPALAKFAKDMGAFDMEKLIKLILKLNKEHLRENDKF